LISLKSLINSNIFSPTEKLILKTYFSLREKIDLFLAEKNPSSFNPYGEISRSFDKRVSEWLIKTLRESGFKGNIITEEKIDVTGEEVTIFIDPIDGSLNAARGIPIYGMTMGFSQGEKHEVFTFGLVWLIPEDRIIMGNMKRTLKITNGNQLFEIESLTVKNDPDTVIETGDTTGEVLREIREHYSIRHFGSIAYSFTKMIEGAIDGIFDNSGKLKMTDVAGFIPILNRLKVPYKIVKIEEVGGSRDNMYNPRVKLVTSTKKEVFQVLSRLL